MSEKLLESFSFTHSYSIIVIHVYDAVLSSECWSNTLIHKQAKSFRRFQVATLSLCVVLVASSGLCSGNWIRDLSSSQNYHTERKVFIGLRLKVDFRSPWVASIGPSSVDFFPVELGSSKISHRRNFAKERKKKPQNLPPHVCGRRSPSFFFEKNSSKARNE